MAQQSPKTGSCQIDGIKQRTPIHFAKLPAPFLSEDVDSSATSVLAFTKHN
jgi:hypothetical protein